MKKILSIVLTIMLVASSIPLSVLQSAAASKISLNTSVSVNCKSAGNWDVRTFTPSTSGTYIFSSSGSLDTLGYIALAEGEAENQNICDDGGAGDNFAVTLKMTAGTTYYLGSTVISGSVGTYTVKIVKFEIDDNTIKPLSISSTTSVTTSLSKGQRFYSCTPSTSGKYVFLSSGSYDAYGYVFDEYWRQIAYASDGGGAQNFRITLDLQGGKTYYFGYSTTSTDEVSFNILLYMSTYIKSVTLINSPVKTSYLKGVDATNISGTNAYHVDLNLSGFEFKINYSNGTVATKSYNSNSSLRGLACETSRTLNSGENVIVFSYMGNSSSFNVSVIDSPVSSLEVAQMPDKTIYYEEDAIKDLDGNKVFHISLSGLVLKVNFKDGTSSNLILNSEHGEEIEYFYFDYTIPMSDMVLGTNTMKLSYYGVKLSFNIKYSLNSDNWEYSVVDNSYVELTKYIGTDKGAVIPETLGGYDVTAIGADCFKANTNITSVRMTEKIITIGDNAFYNCSSIEELTLPKGLTSVGVNAFFGMKGVTKLNWNCENLSYLRANNVFGYLGNDTENGVTLEFGFDCKSIPESAFYMSSTTYNANITKIIVGENVASIGNYAFRECNNLKEVEWNASAIANTVGAANNIWLNCGTVSPFSVTFGEYVNTIPSHLFYSTNATRAPRVSTYRINGKKTAVEAGAFVSNSTLSVTYYCWYDNDDSFASAYDYCLSANYNYVLMDSPLKEIYAYSPASKQEYMFGENLDLTGLIVYAEFEDGTQIDVTADISVSGFDSSIEGNQTITVSYTFIDVTKSITYNVLVLEEPLVLNYIEISKAPNKLNYFAGDNFDSSGLCVTAYYTKEGFTQDVSDKVTFSGYNLNNIGTQTVNVSYTEDSVTRSASFDISVQEIVLTGVEITQQANVKTYFVGAEFNPDGIKLIASYNNGVQEDVTVFAEYSGYDMNKVGEQTVVVSYVKNGVSKSDDYKINVNLPELTSIQIDAEPSEKTFFVGDSFASNGLKVTAKFNDGSQKDVSSSVVLSGYDMNKAGEQTVSVAYTENSITKTANYKIVVNNLVLSSIEIVTEPEKTFIVNDEFSANGIKVTAHYENGASKDVSSLVSFSGYDMESTGKQIVSVSYTENAVTKTDTYEIMINFVSLTNLIIDSEPTAVQYQNIPFNNTGLKVSAIYNNGSKRDVSQSVVISGYNTALFGEQTLNASYTDNGISKSVSFIVTLIKQELTALELISAPSKISYNCLENFDSSGFSAKATYNNGLTKTISDSDATFSGYNMAKVGSQSVVASYSEGEIGKSVSFNISVKNYEKSVSVTALPSKTEYYVGAEKLDTSGLEVTAQMADGSKVVIANSSLSFSTPDFSKTGNQNISVVYESELSGKSFTVSFGINVISWLTSLEIVQSPNKTEFFYGANFSSDGLIVKAHYANGSQADVSALVAVTGYDMKVCSSQNVSVSYTEGMERVSTAYTLTVKNYALSIYVSVPPEKQIYYVGEELNLNGLKVMAKMANGEEKDVTSAVTHSQFSSSSVGLKTLMIFYTTEKGSMVFTSLSLSVKPSVVSLSIITYPQKTTYYIGENLDLTGIVIQATMDDNTYIKIGKDDVTVSGFDNTLASSQVVTLTYSSGKASASTQIIVSVADKPSVTGVSIKTAPTKSEYYVGDDFDASGLVAVANYSNGTSVILASEDYTLSGFESASAGEKTITLKYISGAKEFSASFKVTVNESDVSRCDVDLSGSVDVADIAVVLLQTNYGKLADLAENKRSDVDSNGSVGVSDIAQILLEGHYGVSVK